MYPDEFAYYEAGNIQEVFDLLADHGESQTQLLAGGHSLLPSMKTGLSSPDVLIDIGTVEELRGIDQQEDRISIGAATQYASITDSDVVRHAAPSLVDAVGEIGDEQVRNRGTIGGNIAHADPASDLQAPLLVADATIRVRGPDGSRQIAPAEFFLGLYMTDLRERELVTGIDIPAGSNGAVGVYHKKPNDASGYPIVGVAAAGSITDGAIETARIAANGIMDSVVRLESVEAALAGHRVTDLDVEAVATRALDDLDSDMVMDDNDISADFRLHLLEQYVTKAIRDLLEQAPSG